MLIFSETNNNSDKSPTAFQQDIAKPGVKTLLTWATKHRGTGQESIGVKHGKKETSGTAKVSSFCVHRELVIIITCHSEDHCGV